MRTSITIAAIIAMLSIATAANAGNCGGTSCHRSPVYYPPAKSFNPRPVYSPPAYSPVYDDPAPADDDYGYEEDYAYEDEAVYEEEEYLDDEGYYEEDDVEFFDDPPKLVECEVQIQHPLTFAWKTVKTFNDEASAEEYKVQIEERYWVIYKKAGSAKEKFLEAKNRRDARSKASALRSAGSKITKIDQLEALVTEKPLQPLFDEPGALDNAITAFASANVPNELEPLLGLWQAVTKDAEGEIKKLLLDLNADGTAELTVPTAAGGQATIERDFAIEDGQFKLTNGKAEMVLGDVVSADADKVVLARKDGDITFTRP